MPAGLIQTIICPTCGKTFYKLASIARERGGPKYCSRACYLEQHRKKSAIRLICPQCGRQFESRRYKRRKFCSRECATAHLVARNKSLAEQKPQKSCRYAEKRTKDGKRMHLHRFIVEEYLERELAPNEVIHHIDCNSYNSTLRNLYLFKSRNEHQKAHGTLNGCVPELIRRGVLEFSNGVYAVPNCVKGKLHRTSRPERPKS